METTKKEFIQELAPVLDYIEKHYTEKILISELCNIIHVCDDKLTRLFKKQLGITPTEYIIQMRIARSMELLKTTSLPLEEIAIMSGFASNSYMTRCFKQKVNITPGKYREERKKL